MSWLENHNLQPKQAGFRNRLGAISNPQFAKGIMDVGLQRSYGKHQPGGQDCPTHNKKADRSLLLGGEKGQDIFQRHIFIIHFQ